jgi:hypothetical protein
MDTTGYSNNYSSSYGCNNANTYSGMDSTQTSMSAMTASGMSGMTTDASINDLINGIGQIQTQVPDHGNGGLCGMML